MKFLPPVVLAGKTGLKITDFGNLAVTEIVTKLTAETRRRF